MIPKIETNVKIKYLKSISIHVYTGYITVRSERFNKYLYSKFTGITRLTREDALNDAVWLKNDLLGDNE